MSIRAELRSKGCKLPPPSPPPQNGENILSIRLHPFEEICWGGVQRSFYETF